MAQIKILKLVISNIFEFELWKECVLTHFYHIAKQRYSISFLISKFMFVLCS